MKLIILILTFFVSSAMSAQSISGDEKLHLGAGALISGTTYTIVYASTKNKKIWYSLGASAIAGLGKELIDVAENEGFDTREMIATTAGGLVVSTTINLFTGKKKRKKKLLP